MTDEALDDWPKHPDGTNMTMGEMQPEDRKRIWNEAAARYRARCDGSKAHKTLVEIIDRVDSTEHSQ
jgi:hypothetical protein